jgi:CRP-like cAMP-binding protein/membrane protein YdbS with pleckstrin-like domain
MEPREVLTQLRKIPAFRDLPEKGVSELLRLVPHVRQRTYEAGERLLNESRAPDRTLIILSGRVAIQRRSSEADPNPAVSREVDPGYVLGRTSLEVGSFEPVTATALETTEVLELAFRDWVRVYQQSTYLREHLPSPLKPDRLVGILTKIPLFEKLSDRAGELELYSVAQITHDQVFDHGEWLFRQGEISDRLFVILGGQVQLTQIDPEGLSHDLGVLEAGEVAGETGLLVGDFHDVTATAVDYARALTIMRSEFAALLEKRPDLRRQLSVSTTVERRRNMRSFDWLRDDEWVVAMTQRHWTRLFRQTWLLAILLLLLLPAVVALVASGTTMGTVVAGLLALPIIGLGLGIAWQYINWRDDYFVLTTQRVVHIERVGPFSLQQEETPLSNIQNIYEVQAGFFANLLDYGDLIVQTAGETVEIDMSYVPQLGALRQTITQQVEKTRARDILRTRGEVRELLSRQLTRGITAERDTVTDADAADADETRRPTSRVLPLAIINSFWQYFFPPSWIQTGSGTTVWRRFWLPGMGHYAVPLIAFVVGTVGGAVVLEALWNTSAFFGALVGWLVIEAILLGILLWFVEDWRNDHFELTPSHIILIKRKPLLLGETRNEARLDRIQNLGFEIPSIIARLLDYGHVQFETAGTQGRFELRHVRRPEAVQAAISNHQYAYRERLREIESKRRQQELLTWFTTYNDLQADSAADGEF